MSAKKQHGRKTARIVRTPVTKLSHLSKRKLKSDRPMTRKALKKK